jgi:hypothetical protein
VRDMIALRAPPCNGMSVRPLVGFAGDYATYL